MQCGTVRILQSADLLLAQKVVLSHSDLSFTPSPPRGPSILLETTLSPSRTSESRTPFNVSSRPASTERCAESEECNATYSFSFDLCVLCDQGLCAIANFADVRHMILDLSLMMLSAYIEAETLTLTKSIRPANLLAISVVKHNQYG